MWSLLFVPALAGSLTAVSDPDLTVNGSPKQVQAAWADVDLDGVWDLFAPSAGGAVLLVGVGAPNWGFANETATRAPDLDDPANNPTRALLVGDLDADGAPDLVRTQYDRVDVWLNDGTGDFAVAQSLTGVELQLGTAGTNSTEGAGLADVDLDGDLDLIVTNGEVANLLLVNDGLGAFTAEAVPGVPPASSDFALVTDFDLDGDVDLFLRTTAVGADAWFWTGAAFAEDPSLQLDSVDDLTAKGAVVACDLDRDGAYELGWTQAEGALAPSDPLSWWSWTAVGGFARSPADVGAAADQQVLAVACGDLNNDAELDLVIADEGADQLLDQASGWTTTEIGSSADTFGASLADYDADGDLDVYLASVSASQLLENDEPAADHHLELRILAGVHRCSGSGRVVRDDLGAHAMLVDPTGQVVGGIQDVSGGSGRGGTGWPVLHWGVADPAAVVVARIDPLYLGEPAYDVEVVPSELGALHLLEVATDDHDGDGVLDGDEPFGDSDGDGYRDGYDRDADNDGLSDLDEAGDADPCTDPADSDLDGIPDGSEVDADDDGVFDQDEVLIGTDPTDADTDGDGRDDGDELSDGTDPLDETDFRNDTDGDDLTDDEDPAPTDADADDDGLLDGDEVGRGLDPLDPDSDADGVADGTEIGLDAALSDDTGPTFVPDADPLSTTDPAVADTDADGLTDGAEDADADGAWVAPETDPTRADTDDGGVADGEEVARGSDPNDPADDLVVS
ncbi:MAG: FG-GAP-like repeat-containing protein, partial [Myxococcota bacterium]